MTTQEFMKDKGFKPHSQLGYVGYMDKDEGKIVMVSKETARLMHATYIEGQIEALKRVAAHNNSEYTSDYIEDQIAALDAALTELNKEA